MSTPAQISANQGNAQNSTGPKTEEGKANSCVNNFRHGLTGVFAVLPFENQDEFNALSAALHTEHQPKTVTETLLVEGMAKHHWLAQRAIYLQHRVMEDNLSAHDQERRFALFLRYQTTNERAFHKSLDQLLKLRAEKRKEEIGFESQKLKQADQARKDSIEKRKQDVHKFDVLLAEAKVEHQVVQTVNLEFAAELASARKIDAAAAKMAA